MTAHQVLTFPSLYTLKSNFVLLIILANLLQLFFVQQQLLVLAIILFMNNSNDSLPGHVGVDTPQHSARVQRRGKPVHLCAL